MHTSILKSVLVGLCLLLPLAACAQKAVTASQPAFIPESENPLCAISEADREALMNLNYTDFDQSLPDGGWRKYNLFCPLLTRELIDAYTARHEKTLQKQQWDVLVWHSGQMSALAGDTTDAITKMGKTLKPTEKPDAAFLWNPYVQATIAFLKKDKAMLVSERNKLARGTSPFNRINLRVVDAFVRCSHSTYTEAYSKNCVPPETNVERIRSLAVPFNARKPLPEQFFGLSDFLKMKKVILVGEVHGTQEVPELFGNLVATIANNKTKTLAILEIDQASQASVDAFIKSGDEHALKKDAFFKRELQDGRSSKAMMKLLKQLAKLPNTKVLCMDPANAAKAMPGQERDTAMAAFIDRHRSGYQNTFVLAGNIHSATSIGTPWDKTYRPMGYELKQIAKDLPDDQLLNILVRHGTLESWHCRSDQVASCKVYSGNELISDYSTAVRDRSYFVWELPAVEGHNASIFLRATKASLPALQK